MKPVQFPPQACIEELIAKVGLPKGFRRLKWAEAAVGQEVWLWCQRQGKPRVAGPHKVVSVQDFVLANRLGKQFHQPVEDLLVKIQQPERQEHNMSDRLFHLVLSLTMASDPSPLTPAETDELRDELNKEAVSRGFADWIDAYHQFPKTQDTAIATQT